MKITGLFLLVVALGFMQIGTAQTVRTTGSLTTFRANHQSQTLLNGQILTFGGQNNGVLNSAELYDPSTELWTPTGDMMQARTQFASVLLDDGRVLAIGGSDGSAETSTCEIFDPGTGTWSFTGSLSLNTSFPAAAKLDDGRVLMTYQTTCEIYHPDSAQWYPAPSPSEFRSKLILLNNGKVLSVGINASAEIFDPTTNTWSPVSNSLRPNVTSADGVNLLGDGRVLIIGGSSAAADIYDPVSNSFSAAADLLVGIPFCGTVSMKNGTVLIFGPSSSANGNDTKSIQIYNPINNQWFTDIYTFYGPTRSRLHLLPGGSVVSVGGSARFGGLEASCYFISSRVAAVSKDDLIGDISVLLSPNPARDLLQVELGKRVAASLRLMDVQGKLVGSFALTDISTQVALGHLPRGLYFYSIQDRKQKLQSGKLLLE